VSHLPDAIRVRVSSRDGPLASLLVLTRIVMHEQNDFWGIFGPTDSNGELLITRAELLGSAQQTRAYYGDEFSDPETQLAGLIEVRVLDEAGITRALEAAGELTDYPYAPGYAAMLAQARDAVIAMGRVLMEVAVTAEGGDCEVKAQPPI
jgi:hypothetical protein